MCSLVKKTSEKSCRTVPFKRELHITELGSSEAGEHLLMAITLFAAPLISLLTCTGACQKRCGASTFYLFNVQRYVSLKSSRT